MPATPNTRFPWTSPFCQKTKPSWETNTNTSPSFHTPFTRRSNKEDALVGKAGKIAKEAAYFWSSYARLMLKISSYSPQTTKKFSCKNSKAARITTKTESESARNRNHLFLQLFKKRHQSYQFEVWSIHWLLSIWSIHLLSHHIKNKWMQCHFLGKTCSWKYPGLQMHNAPQLVESTTK